MGKLQENFRGKGKRFSDVIPADNPINNKIRKILLSIMCISLFFTAAITATTALFTGEKEVETHVVTGYLEFDFKRTNLIGQSLNGRGFLEEFSLNDEVNLKESGADAFDIKGLVPGATYTGDFLIENTGTTAFEAKISFINLENNSDYILQQIKVTLGYNDKHTTYSLCDFEQISLDLGVLEVKEDAKFTISINLPTETTNEAQSQNVYFDLKLEATQVLFEK